MKFICSRFDVVILASMFVLAGCSGRQIYQSAAGWRLNECQKILENAERARCMEQASKDYETYRREGNDSPGQR
jgi:hypothetical protein